MDDASTFPYPEVSHPGTEGVGDEKAAQCVDPQPVVEVVDVEAAECQTGPPLKLSFNRAPPKFFVAACQSGPPPWGARLN